MTKRAHPSESVMEASAKVGIHPHLLTSDDVLAALSEGKISVEECEDLMGYVDRVEHMVGKDSNPKNFKDVTFGRA
jgi:hypothetical protein